MLPYTVIHNRQPADLRASRAPADTTGQARLNPWLLWRPERPQAPRVLSVAELAECRCPDICNRDHANE
jgi:hypothetical protein